jgi:hypothetical protein
VQTELYDEGVYQARPTAWGFCRSKNGNDQFFLAFLVLKQFDPESPETTLPCICQERTLYRQLLTEQHAGWLLSDLRSIGFTGATFSSLDLASPDAIDLSRQLFRVRCRHSEYAGELRETWQIVRSATANIDRLPQEKVRELDSRFAVELANHAHKVATAAPALPAPPEMVNPQSPEDPF